MFSKFSIEIVWLRRDERYSSGYFSGRWVYGGACIAQESEQEGRQLPRASVQ